MYLKTESLYKKVAYKKHYTFFIILAIAIFATSCVTSKHVNYMQKPSASIPDYPDTIKFEDYKLQKGDYLNIRVYSLNDADISLYNCGRYNISRQAGDAAGSRLCLYMIDEDGKIEYPYLGEIEAEGKTTRQLKFELEDLFKQDVAKHLSVDVYLANRSFSIIGEGKSSRINLPHEKITIFQALAMAGDLTTYADRKKVKLVRNTPEGTIVKEFDLRTEKIIDSEYYYIQPNDVIYIQYSFAKHVGITHISNAISVTLSTTSFGLMIYGFGKRIYEDVSNQKNTK